MGSSAIALLTDFGVDDVYVGVVKLVLAARAPRAALIDLSHGVPAGDVVAGALYLAGAQRYLPMGTVVLAVVDPGVGSARRAVAVQTECGFWVGPDNGLFTLVLTRESVIATVELEVPATAAPTFHGRDLFAPAAAHLANGGRLAELGPPVTTPLVATWPAPLAVEGGLRGRVVHVDRFGNLVTNLPPPGRKVLIADHELPFVDGGHYAQVASGELVALTSSFGFVEVAVRDGSAHERLAAGRGTVVELRF